MKRIRLSYQGPTTPFSDQYGDVYFMTESGVAESTYVYLEGSGLQSRLQECADPASPNQHIRVGEIGFGVGLNFLLTAEAFLKARKPGDRLSYFSVENQPVHQQDLMQLYQKLPPVCRLQDRFLEQYPLLVPGHHPVEFADVGISLHLLWGEAEDQWSKLYLPETKKIQHWYWDGFSPSKNPEAFSKSLFQILRIQSSADARGASFTSAGWVRRGLEESGFQVQKRKGFGNKRECIEAKLFSDNSNVEMISVVPSQNTPPWFRFPKNTRTVASHHRVAIIGAGLSGSAIARALAKRNIQVTVFDGNGIASAASGNRAGLFNVQLSRKPNPISRFAQLSLAHFLREITELSIPVTRGILRTKSNDPNSTDQTDALHALDYPDDFYEVRSDGIYFPDCGIVSPKNLCERRLDHPNITLRQTDFPDFIPSQMAEFDHCVFAGGYQGLKTLKSLHDFQLKGVHGQTIQVRSNASTQTFRETRVNSGYLTPDHGNGHLLGATYSTKEPAQNQVEINTAALIEEARNKFSGFENLALSDVISTWQGTRLSGPDKLPLIGPAFDSTASASLYQDWKTRRERPLPKDEKATLPVIPGMWILTAMGSRGITFSSLGAEILTSMMLNDALPIEADLLEHLHPVRFFIRNLKRSRVN